MKARICVITGIVLILAGFIGVITFCMPYVEGQSGKTFDAYIADEEQVEPDGFPVIDWDALRATNPDVVAWVRVEGTPIDYPIVQAPASDPQHYLHYDFYGEYNIYGCPYIDFDCPGTDAQNVLVYGHNMIDGSMFAAFADYTTWDYFLEHNTILLMTPDKNMRLEAIAAEQVSANNDNPIVSFDNASALHDYLQEHIDNSDIIGRVPSSESQIYSFVCCSYLLSNGRTVVYAVDPASSATKF